ncbi:MAG: hypothetical protein J6K85_01510, partial [Clostridia bacterium]|nr:hypothetical protein [Clostridia bacterium]
MAQNRKRLFFSLLAMMLSVALMIGFTPGLYAFAAEASAEETVESGIKAIDLDLGNTIAVKLYTEAVENDGSKVVVAFGGEETEITAQKGGVFTFSGVAPQHMSDTLTATLYAADGTAVGASATFSVRSYLEALLLLDYENSGCKTTWQYTAMKELAVNLLNYGAAAQIYTDYNVDDLANKNLTDEQKALATDTIAVSGSDKAVNGDSWVGAGVRFDYRLGIYFIFEAESLEGITASVNGNPVTPQLYNRAKNQYVIRYASFDATNMNSVITAKLNVGDTEETYAYSIKSYVAAKGGDNSALSELVNATYKYGFSAVAYAGDLVTVDPTFDTTGSASIDGKGYDFTGSAYGDVTLPKLSLADYTTSSSIDGESATPVVTTTYTLKGGAVKYSTTVESSDAIKVNGNIYSKYELSLLNNDEVEVTYDEENGYTYRAKTAQTLTSLAAYGNALTIIGDVTIVRDTADWNHYNALNIGTATEKANVTVNNAAGATRGITFRSAADMYVAEGSSFTVTSGGTYSIMAYEQGTTILVDGTMTVASKIRLEKAPAIDASYEYGFQPALYVRKGTVTVEAGQLISNSVQVGSERDGYQGTLNITQTAKGTNYATTYGTTQNTICTENTGELVRYVFANGNVHLTDASTAALTGIDARTSASSYVEFGSGITFKTSGGYTYLLGCWVRGSDYRFSIHTDAKFDLTLSGAVIAVGYTTSNHITYHST